MTEVQSPLLTRAETAEWLRVSESTVYRMTRDGILRQVKARGRVFWSLAELETWLKRNEKRLK